MRHHRHAGDKARGGTIYINGERTIIDGSNFNKSHASKEGGVIYIVGEHAVIDSSTFNNSYSSSKGGAIAVTGHNATIERSVFEDCKALRTIEVPSSVHRIKSRAFSGIKNLTVNINKGQTVIISDDAFDDEDCLIIKE